MGERDSRGGKRPPAQSGRSSNSSAQGKRPTSQTSHNSAPQSKRPVSQTSQKAASQGKRPASQTSQKTASQGKRPASQTPHNFAPQSKQPVSQTSHISASQGKRPASQTPQKAASQGKRFVQQTGYEDARRSSAKQSVRADNAVNERRASAAEQELHSSEYARQLARQRRQRNYKRNRRLLMFLYYAAITIAVVSVALIMSTTVLFNITEVRLDTGEGVPYSDEQIKQLCTVEPGQNMFTAPLDETSQAITAGLPYIETCTVRRKLPSTVIIETTAAEIMGVAHNEFGQNFIVSTGYRALEAIDDVSASDVPMLNGVTLTSATVGMAVTADDQARLEQASQIITIMDGYGIQLESITFSPAGYITADYDGRVELIIGTTANLEDKLKIAATLINEGKITKNESGELDLTIGKQATFRPDYLIGGD